MPQGHESWEVTMCVDTKAEYSLLLKSFVSFLCSVEGGA